MAQIQDKNRANAMIVLPVVGETKFDENGIAEVDDDKVNDLLAKVEGLGLGPGHRDNEELKAEEEDEEEEEVQEQEEQAQEEAPVDENDAASDVVNEGASDAVNDQEEAQEEVSSDGADVGAGSESRGVPEDAVDQESSEEGMNSISNEEVANKIKTSNLKELKELAEVLDVPASEWGSLKKAELKDYLLNKIK